MTIGQGAVRPEQSGSRGYIPTLDGWRALAVLLVIGSHSVVMLRNGGSAVGRALIGVFEHAGFGVDIFFALSGYLITTLLLRERERSGSIDLRRFYIRRFFRIVPPIIAYLAVVSGLGAAGRLPDIRFGEIVASVLFARNYADGSFFTAHFWSLSIEEHFYAVIPLLLLVLPRRAMLAVSLTLIFACVIVRWWEFRLPVETLGGLPQFRTENRIDALMWGSVLAQLCRDDAVARTIRRCLSPAVTALLAIAAVALLFVLRDDAARRTIVAAVLPLLIVHTVFHPAGRAGRLLETRPIRFVGRLSYSLYIWQMLFLPPGVRPLGTVQSFPWALLLPVILALTSYRFIEKPMIRLGHRLGHSTPLAVRKSVDIA